MRKFAKWVLNGYYCVKKSDFKLFFNVSISDVRTPFYIKIKAFITALLRKSVEKYSGF